MRLGKIFTDLPLSHDRPTSFGVKEFCDVCQRCSDACPAKAIPHDAPRALAARFRRFSQRDQVFCRAFWDPDVHSAKTRVFYETYRKPLKHFREVDGFTQKDYSIRNASWYVSDIFAERFQAEDRREGFLDALTWPIGM